MDATNYSAALLGALAAMAFSAASGRGIAFLFLFAAGLALGVFFGGFSSPEVIGLLAAAAAAAILLRSDWIAIAAPMTGMLAGLTSMLMSAQLQVPGAYPLVFLSILAGVVALLNRRADFAPPALKDEAFMFIALFGALVAAVPGIASGWASALALNVAGAQSLPIPGWVFALAATSVALGGVYSMWRRAN